MPLYDWIKYVHIVGATLLIAQAVVGIVLHTLQHLPQAAVLLPRLSKLQRIGLYQSLFYLSVFMPVTGFWMAYIATYDFAEFWLYGSLSAIGVGTLMLITAIFRKTTVSGGFWVALILILLFVMGLMVGKIESLFG